MNNDSKKEWIVKAEHDYVAAKDLIRRRTKPIYDIVCFHCQQCVEKYLKAFLTANKIRYPKSHDLMRLLDLCVAKDGAMEFIRDLIKPLSDYAVGARYPGEDPHRSEAKYAIKVMEEARKVVRQRLGRTKY